MKPFQIEAGNGFQVLVSGFGGFSARGGAGPGGRHPASSADLCGLHSLNTPSGGGQPGPENELLDRPSIVPPGQGLAHSPLRPRADSCVGDPVAQGAWPLRPAGALLVIKGAAANDTGYQE